MLSVSMFSILCLSCISPTRLLAGDAGLRLKTSQGKVEGKTSGALRIFLGIPYAAPPVGPLRWKPPQPAAKWKGVRQATEFGSHCMQPKLFGDMIFRDPGISEDCLTLNVWTPARGKKAKLPVMVWIYGGGFTAGGSSEPRQDGASLAGHGVVVVSMNYRLNIFGFFAHKQLDAESGKDASGNYGLLDQTAALRWVQRNISSFGGDPAKVTIFGESAGSFSVSAQMASPLARGLFQRAIGESGGGFFRRDGAFDPKEDTERRDADFAQTALMADTLDRLRAIPAQQLMEAAFKKDESGRFLEFTADIDGYFLPEGLPAIFAAGRQNDVPLLAGWNRDENGMATNTTIGSFQQRVSQRYGANAAAILKLYPAADDAQAVRSAADLSGDEFIAFSTWRWMEAQARTGKQPIYRYRFDLAPPPDTNHPQEGVAYHSAEIAYVFGALDLLHGYAWRPEDHALSEQMQQYWTNFAKAGDPNGAGLPTWPVYKATDWKVMHLDETSAAQDDKTRDRELFLDEIWGH
jgi:para-nitrobenzyl esterase